MSDPLVASLERIGAPRVLVVGDVIADRYVFGSVDRISPEAPIQVLAVRREEFRVGGAGNVACNLAALGAETSLVGTVGDDAAGRKLRDAIGALARGGDRGDSGGVAGGRRADFEGLVTDPGRPTIEKTRMVASAQQVLRVDREDARPLGAEVESEVVRRVEAALAGADLVVLSDYGKGLLTDRVLRAVIEGARTRGIRTVVDPKGLDFGKYRSASIITPNRSEAERVTGRVLESTEDFAAAGARLVADLDLEAAVITLGARGIWVHPKDGEPFRVDARARAVFDVTGAGDTVVAVLALSLAGGATLRDAIRLANTAAGIVVGKVGTATVTRAEIVSRLLEGSPFHTPKDLPLPELCRRLDEVRAAGRSVVFTNGCFDLVHAGHVHYLEFARSQGDVLVVGLNGDTSIRELKGEGRPIQPLRERKRLLGALEMVDFLVAFDEPTPIELIRSIRPDVLVKGEDWRDKGVVGRDLVESAGGRVVLAPFVPGQSTTGIVARIRAGEDAASSTPPS